MIYDLSMLHNFYATYESEVKNAKNNLNRPMTLA